VDVKELPAAERLERAYDLSIAALLGETIYNFGELVRVVNCILHSVVMAYN
jgi:26S proteasome regulatory subunit N9